MAFDFAPAMVTPGRTIPVVLNMLPGSPTVHLEHLGPDNKTWLAAQVASANAAAPKKGIALGRERPKIDAKDLTDDTEQRADLVHALRHLEATHTDGTPATDADIPEFIAGLPSDIVRRLHFVASNIENYRNGQFNDPKAIAEK